MSGTLTHGDYEHFVPACERLAKQHGRIRVLFEMTDFHGREGAALSDDIKVDLKHFSEIERLAMVGDFTTATVRYFDHAAIENARAWLASGAQ